MFLHVSLPAGAAEIVVEEGLADEALDTRSLGDAVAVGISVLELAANLSTVVASADELGAILKGVFSWARSADGRKADHPLQVSVTKTTTTTQTRTYTISGTKEIEALLPDLLRELTVNDTSRPAIRD
jgi:hypothetical protein